MYIQSNLNRVLDNFRDTTEIGVSKITLADVSIPTLYAVQLFPSVEFSTVTTSKNYIVLYSTDHDSGDGGCYWGECDDLELNGFQENGLIVSGFQAETPYLMWCENDPDGEQVHLYYHPNQHFPDGNGKQQTRLLTTTGGLLHTAPLTDRGKPLGLTAEENAYQSPHTGYLQAYTQPDGSFIGFHSTKGNNSASVDGIPNIGISTTTDFRTWTRLEQDLDITSYMPANRQLHYGAGYYFTYEGQQYVVGSNMSYNFDFANSSICLVKSNNYVPFEYVKDISSPNGGNGQSNNTARFDGVHTLHIYYVINRQEVFHTTLDLRSI